MIRFEGVTIRTIACLLLSSLLVASCSGAREDVRVSFCKKLVLTQVDSPGTVRWTKVVTDPQRQSGLSVVLDFEAQDTGGGTRTRQATCQYRYNALDDNALTLSDPLSAFATSPESMQIDGKPVSRSTLATAIKNDVIMQGKAVIDRAKKGLEDAATMARDRLESADGQ
jgi:hypothetical protein